MLPFHVCCAWNAARLFELQDGRFQIIDSGLIAPLMCGPGYVLIENPLADFFQEIKIPQVVFRPAVIWDRREDIESKTHQKMSVNCRFSSSQIHQLDLDGERIFVMSDEYLFVTPALKNKLENSTFNSLCFSEGLSGFG
jgi:hypothetical protein